MRLNGGAGKDIRPKPEWINMDIRDLFGVDVIGDVRHLPFSDEYFEEALFQDVAEHLPSADIEKTLQEWWRVVKPGGLLSIRVPDFLKIFRATMTRKLSPEKAFELIFGDQSDEAGGYEYGGHKQAMTKEKWAETFRSLKPKPDSIIIEEDPNEFNLYCLVKKSE